MNSLTVSSVAVIAMVFVVETASAYTLVPTRTPFAAIGGIDMIGPGLAEACSIKLLGRVYGKGVGEINFANIETGVGCPKQNKSTGLPWKFKATAMSKGKLFGVDIVGPGVNCGPSTIPVKIGTTGVVTFNNVSMLGGCTVSGSMQTNPQITTAP